MSDDWLQYAPIDPCHRPSPQAAESSKALLEEFFPDAEEVTFEYFDQIQFVDPVGNWSGVLCSGCGADAEPWWNDAAMSVGTSPASLMVVTPCCHKSVSLNDMQFVQPAAFGSFVLKVVNPWATAPTPEQRRELEQTLGCALKEVWARH
jgi:hypothetical protein